MVTSAVGPGERVEELKKIYLWAVCNHRRNVARWAIIRLHELTGLYGIFNRHGDKEVKP